MLRAVGPGTRVQGPGCQRVGSGQRDKRGDQGNKEGTAGKGHGNDWDRYRALGLDTCSSRLAALLDLLDIYGWLWTSLALVYAS